MQHAVKRWRFGKLLGQVILRPSRPARRPRRTSTSLEVEQLDPRILLSTFADFDSPGTFFAPDQLGVAPGPTVIPGGPTGNFLRLATTTVPNHNTIAFDRTEMGAFNQITADFDFRMTPGLPEKADGFSFALVDTATYGTTGPVAPPNVAEEPNYAHSLGVGFDTYRNGDLGDINNNNISIHFDGNVVRQVDVTPFVDLADGEFIHARILLRPAVGLSDVTVILTPPGGQPVTVADRVAVPGLTPYEGRIVFGARSGGGTADHDLDNIDVQFVNAAPLLNLVSPTNVQLPASDAAGGASQPMSSADGRFTVYTSTAPNLVPGQVNTTVGSNVFLYDQQTGTTTLVSHIPGSVTTTANSDADGARISGDGRYIAYQSTARNLVQGQAGPSNLENVFLYDRATGSNTLLSHRFDSTTITGNNDSVVSRSTGFGFSNNSGRFLLFNSSATDLVAGQNGPSFENLFLYDTTTGTTTLVSHNTFSPVTGSNSDAENADLTPDGRFVVFESFATDVVVGQTGSVGNIFLYETATNTSRLVSGIFVGLANSPTRGAGFSSQPFISADGRMIAYISAATLLVANQTGSNGAFQPLNVFGYDTQTQTTFLVSGTNGSPSQTADFSSAEAVVSSDGSTIAFLSDADNLLAGQGNASGNVFRFDTATRQLTLVSHANNALGMAAGGVDASVVKTFDDLSLSADGRFISYHSTASNLAAGQTGLGGVDNVFVYDRNSGQNTLVSHRGGAPAAGGNRDSDLARLSLSGNRIAFLSRAADLSPGVTVASGGENLFLSLVTPTADPALVSRTAFQATASSLTYGTSLTGRFVLYASNSPSGVPNQVDTNFDQDLFLLDRDTDITTLVSHVAGQLTTAGDLGSPTTAGVVDSANAPVLSSDGNFVAFVSQASNLVAGQYQFRQLDQVFLFNRMTGTVKLLSHHFADATLAGNGASYSPVISADGRYVAFSSDAPDLLEGLIQPVVGGVVPNVFLYDTVTDTITLVSHAAGQVLLSGDYPSGRPAISDDGRLTAYYSLATDLVAGATIVPTYNVYLFDRSTGTSTLVSHVASSATVSPQGRSSPPVLSADGNFVAFASFAADLVAGQTGPADTTNVFLYNRLTGVNTLVSGVNGSPSATGNGYSDSPALNDDGNFVAFHSTATNLVPGQSGPARSNIYLFNRLAGTAPVTLVSHARGSTLPADGDATTPRIDGDGMLVAYLSTSSNLVPNQSGGGVNNVFGWSRTQDMNFLASGVDGSPNVISPAPAFLPILSRDPVILFTIAGSLVTGVTGMANGYVNTLVDITLTPTPFLDGSPAGTRIGTFAITTVLLGQAALPTFNLPVGVADNNRYRTGTTAPDGTAPLVSQVVVDVTVQASFRIVVQTNVGFGFLVQRGFTLTANAMPGSFRAYVTQLYRTLLRRDPEPAGLAYWEGVVIRSGRSAAAQGIRQAPEHLGLEVDGFYATYLQRPADAPGRNYWIGKMQEGMSATAAALGFLTSAEYAQSHPDAATYVRGLYTDILGRTGESNGLTYWQGITNTLGRGVAALGILTSDEKYARLVDGYYASLLRRPADEAGRLYWVDQLRSKRQTLEQVAAAFLVSDEFIKSAGK